MKASASVRSSCEKEFALKSVASGIRLDGRQAYDYRDISITFGDDYGHCQVSIGETRVLAQVSSEIVKPPPNRGSEGQLFLNVELSPMAAPQFESNRMSAYSVEINRFIERCLRESRPVDMESLCIVTGEKVWCLRVDVTVMDDAGNVNDCACIAAISALAHYRYPDVSVIGDQVVVHSVKERDPVPLNVYHFPICVSLGFIQSGDKVIVDPTSLEEDILSGRMMMAINANREICCAQMSGGVFLEPEQIMMCAKLAIVKVSEITKKIKKELERDKKNRAPPSVSKQSISSKSFEEKLADISGQRPITQTVAQDSAVDITMSKRNGKEKADLITLDSSKISKVTKKGLGTASIGSGGASSWVVISDEDEDAMMGDEDFEPEPSTTKTVTPKNGHVVDVITLGSDVDSEEEETVVLTSKDICSQSRGKEVSDTRGDVICIDDSDEERNKAAPGHHTTMKSKSSDSDVLEKPHPGKGKKKKKKKKKEVVAL